MENPIFPISKDGRGKGVCNRSGTRKRLADISNLQRQTQSPNQGEKRQQVMTREYVDRLEKENVALVKLVAERNKIIELSRVEVQKLQVNLQIYQQQNTEFAKANSQMLAELNSGKDRLKALQHELGCKNGILQGKQLDLKEKEKRGTRVKNEIGTAQDSKGAGSLQADRNNSKPHTTKRKRQSGDSCLGPDKQDQLNEKVNKNRNSSTSRRQSSSLKSEQRNPSDDAFEIDNSKFPVSTLRDDGLPDESATSSNAYILTDNRKGTAACQQEALHSRRSSVGRPSRQAAQKVQSYKEKPLNVKLRREA